MTKNMQGYHRVADKRLFVVSKKGVLVGVFSNKKKLLEALEISGVEDCYIAGERKAKQVTQSSLQTSFCNGHLKILDFNTNETVYRIWEVGMNHINRSE